MYGHDSQPSRVYAYGARRPLDLELVRAQLHGARRYRNELVALERERRERANEIIRSYFPRVLALDAEIEAAETRLAGIREAVRKSNSAARRRDPDPARAAEARALRAALKAMRTEHREQRRQAYGRPGRPDADPPVPEIRGDPRVRAELDGLDATIRERSKRTRAECGLHWGTYLTVEQGLSGIRSGPPPRFVGRGWTGKLAVQVQGGATWDELLVGPGQARVEPQPVTATASPTGRRSKRPVWLLYLRVGSEGPANRTPVWARIPFVLHRAIPAGGHVKWIYLVHRRIATHDEWSVQFVVARDAWVHADTTEAAGTAALNLGWRTLEDDSLRVAYVVADDGHREELVVPAAQLDRWGHADSLQSIRDREYMLVHAALMAWLASADVPDWLRDATATLAQWRSAARLAGLAIRWRGERFDGDAEMFGRLEAWRRQDKHLYDWLSYERLGAQRWRDDHYRRFAARLRWRYETVVVDDTDWRALLQRPAAEEDTDPERLNTRRRARIASPGRLREIARHGHPDVQVRPAAYVTQTCHHCGVADKLLDRSARVVRCTACGAEADQDLRAATNLLRSASGGVVGAGA